MSLHDEEFMEDIETIGALICQLLSDGSRVVGYAIVRSRLRTHTKDKKSKSLDVFQFFDTERFANLEAALLQTSPTHVFLCTDNIPESEIEKVENVLQSTDISYERAPRSFFNANEDTKNNLRRLEGGFLSSVIEDDYTVGIRSAQCLLVKGDLIRNAEVDSLFGCWNISPQILNDHMRLDAAAVRALNLFSSAKENTPVASDSTLPNIRGVSPNVSSLFNLVSHSCKTTSGKRVLRSWILQPLVNADAIRTRQKLVSAFVNCTSMRMGWGTRAGEVPDLERLSAKLQRKKADIKDMIRLYAFAMTLQPLAQLLVDFDGPEEDGAVLREKYGNPLSEFAEDLARYCAMMEELVEDPSDIARPRIKRSWSSTLQRLGMEKDEWEQKARELYAEAIRPGGWGEGMDIRLDKDSNRLFEFRTNKSNEKLVRNVPLLTQDDILVRKDGIRFVTSRGKYGGLSTVREGWKDADNEYASAQKEVVDKAVETAVSYLPVIEGATSIIAELDAYYSLAMLATNAPGTYVCPTILDEVPFEDGAVKQEKVEGSMDVDGEQSSSSSTSAVGRRHLRLVGGRHPVMEMQDGINFIPNDYEMSNEDETNTPAAGNRTFPGRFHIITGMNMGGKSTYIRSVGCICLLAQIGSYVPAEEAELTPVDSICARVGAGDRALRGVSTFMSEMLEASTILSSATPRSLVIIDELGRGTSTYDGFGLAWAISEHLALNTKCFTFFATHFHELTSLADDLPKGSVRNRHVTAEVVSQNDAASQSGGKFRQSEDNIIMLYEVRDGVCPSSFGIQVAEMAHFPRSVISLAKAKAAQLESTSGIVLNKKKAQLQRDSKTTEAPTPSTEPSNAMAEKAVNFVQKLASLSETFQKPLSAQEKRKSIVALLRSL